ncbi:hypothetical protein QE152_g29164 [Popillia japonica]|uniref:Uncharacterized protein n=1 Tax=Popillia japonica TaxID=7064 RepID=A0AAW1JIP1_POPJA
MLSLKECDLEKSLADSDINLADLKLAMLAIKECDLEKSLADSDINLADLKLAMLAIFDSGILYEAKRFIPKIGRYAFD